MSLAQKNDQEAYEMGVSKAFKPIMENTLKYLNVGSKKMKQNLHIFKSTKCNGQSTDKAKESLNRKIYKQQLLVMEITSNLNPLKQIKIIA